MLALLVGFIALKVNPALTKLVPNEVLVLPVKAARTPLSKAPSDMPIFLYHPVPVLPLLYIYKL